jgi:hypothetical protein
LWPPKPVGRFTAAENTNQELIDQGVILVNGQYIALALRQVA